MTKSLPDDSRSADFAALGIQDPCLREDMALGADVARHLVPDDPDDRQYWLWDVDPLETEICEDDAAN